MTGKILRSFLIGDFVPFSELEKLLLTLSTIYKTSRYILLHFSAQNTRGDEILEVNIITITFVTPSLACNEPAYGELDELNYRRTYCYHRNKKLFSIVLRTVFKMSKYSNNIE